MFKFSRIFILSILLLSWHNPTAGDFPRAFDAVYRQLERNYRGPITGRKHHHAIPGGPYRGVYLWDSAFIAQIWRVRDVNKAKEVIFSVIENQHGSGLIPQHSAYNLLGQGSNHWTNPPLLSWSSLRIFQDTGDLEFLNRVYRPLARNFDWIQRNRRLHNGLYFWKHRYESGLDNSPRFSDRAEKHCAKIKQLAAIDLASYMVLDAESLSAMATHLGFTDEATSYLREADRIRALINELLWDEKEGYYFDLNVITGERVRVRSVASLVPLIAGVPDPDRAERVIKMVLDPNGFNTPIPFPSVAKDDPKFELDYWRGPVWINMAYLGILGLELYGHHHDAQELSAHLISGVYQAWENTGQLVEYYDPERTDFKRLSRKKGNLIKNLFTGNKPVKHFVGWTGLVNTLLIEELNGQL